MRIHLLFCFLLAGQILYAQDTTVFAPQGAVWHYRPWTPGPDTGLYSFTAAGDTQFGVWNARILRCSVWAGGAFQAAPQLDKYVATLGNKVYYRVNGQFVLLFDFGAAPGDTIASEAEGFSIFNGCVNPESGTTLNFQYRVDSVGTLNVGGENLRLQYLTTIYDGAEFSWCPGGFSGSVVERIGAPGAGYWWGNGCACILSGIPGYLRCYDDADLHYSNPSIGAEACGVSSAPEPAPETLQLTPNPAARQARLPFVPDQVQIYNSLGQLQICPNDGELLDLSALAPGIYHVLAGKDGRRYAGRLAVGRQP